jgi:hypothetical protein
MPTVLRAEGYRLYFYSHETNEPPHIHVDKEKSSAKFWLNPVSLSRNAGYSAIELRIIRDIITLNKNYLLEKWYGFFNQ